MSAAAPVQLLVYRFGAEAGFGGHLVGALERMEAGGALRVLDALVVGTDDASGETFAIEVHGGSAGGLVSALLSFRLDAAGRGAATRRTLARGGERAELIQRLAAALEPGQALVALLVEHAWARVLGRAVELTSGSELVNAIVEQSSLSGLGSELLAAAGRPAAGSP